jgi:putative NADH-flavin reductase
MSKLLTVIGATGTQGQSVIEAALKDKSYSIRGVTRNPSSEKAKLLASKGIEVVKADLNDEQSLVKAFEVIHSIPPPGLTMTDAYSGFFGNLRCDRLLRALRRFRSRRGDQG